MLNIQIDISDENHGSLSVARKPPVSGASGLGKRQVLGKRRALGEITNVTPSHRGSKAQSFADENLKQGSKIVPAITPGPEDSLLKKAKVVLTHDAASGRVTPLQAVPTVLRQLASRCPSEFHQAAQHYADEALEVMGKPWEEAERAMLATEAAAMRARAIAACAGDVAAMDAQIRSRCCRKTAKISDDWDTIKEIPSTGEDHWACNPTSKESTCDPDDFLKNLQGCPAPEDLVHVDMDDLDFEFMGDEMVC